MSNLLGNLLSRLNDPYKVYVRDYKRYLKMRGFGDHLDDEVFVKRAFIECWAEPGFHNFWRVWNPGVSYFCYRFYLLLEGVKNRDVALIFVFVINGILHNLVALPFCKSLSFPLPFTFLSFGVLTVVSRRLEKVVCQRNFPWIFNATINVGLVLVSFDFGFYINDLLCSRVFGTG